MSVLQPKMGRLEAPTIGLPILATATNGVGRESTEIAAKLREFGLGSLNEYKRPPTRRSVYSTNSSAQSLEEQLFNALAGYKVQTSQVMMHLDRGWRDHFFRQLDNLLDAGEWEETDSPPTNGSFTTFLRLITFLKPQRRPGLASSHDGRLIATWSTGPNHLTIECLPKDMARWNLVAFIEDEKERAAAVTPVQRLPAVLEPYSPGRWFSNAVDLP